MLRGKDGNVAEGAVTSSREVADALLKDENEHDAYWHCTASKFKAGESVACASLLAPAQKHLPNHHLRAATNSLGAISSMRLGTRKTEEI